MSNRVRGRILSRTRDPGQKRAHKRQFRTFARLQAEKDAERAREALLAADFTVSEPESVFFDDDADFLASFED